MIKGLFLRKSRARRGTSQASVPARDLVCQAAVEVLERRQFFSASASYLGIDHTTQGNWHGTYGSGGALIANDSTASVASGVTVSTSAAAYSWDGSPSATRALQTGNNTGRIASAYYGDNVSIDVNVGGSATKQVSLYALDWDSTSRGETITVTDASTHAVLDTESTAGFANGQYLSWNVSGDVVFSVQRDSGANAVVSGVFIDSAGTPVTPAAPTGVAATPFPQELDLTWTPSNHALSYNVLVSTDGGSTYSTAATGVTTSSYDVTGLTNGSNYTVAVTATNTAGTSTASSSTTASPSGHWQTIDAGVTPSILDGTISAFSGGASLASGIYRVNYVSGTMTYSAGVQGYRVNAFSVGDFGFKVAEGGVTSSSDMHAVGTSEEGGAATSTVGLRFSHAGGSIGVYLQDSPYDDNVAGSTSPTFSLEELVA